ncbi:MAG: pyruvate formate lyase family protein, partial [Armatimonadetes bacterium]|nr:pyruvate formate lyase family protein [Candidatus Hippobium faecium]
MFPKYIYELKDYYLSGTHRNCNMVSAESTGVTFPHAQNKSINYANAIKAIAENAPLFIHRDTKIVGSATYREASQHIVPILNIGSVSHTTIDFRTVTEKGTDYLKNRIISCLTENPSFSCKEHIASQSDKRAFWEAQLICIEALEIWHKRYTEKLREEKREDILSYFENIPKKGAENFKEAVQSLFFVFAFVRLCGNWPGIGRIDEILYPYYKKDLEEGKITYKEAREFLANMWVCGCEWAWGYDTDKFTAGSGDAQHYQNIVIGGCDRQGKDITNDITYMVLDIAGELSISDYPISVRLSRNTPEKLHRKTAEVIKKGGGIVACYNEAAVIEALIKFGYTEEEARSFANDGCWEAIIPGKTNFIYTPFDT